MLGRIKFSVGVQLDRALLALGFRHLGAAGAFGVQLLQHGGAGGVVQTDIQNLGAGHLDPPILDHRRHLFAHLDDQIGPVGLHLVQFQLADLAAHDPGDGGGNRAIHVADAVHGLFRLGDAIEDAGFHLDQHVVGGDGILAGGGKLAFQHRNLVCHPVQKRHDEVDARPQHGAQPAKAFHHMLFALRHDPHAKENAEQQERRKRKQYGVAAQKIVKIHDAPLCCLVQHGPAHRPAQHLRHDKVAPAAQGCSGNSYTLDSCRGARATDGGAAGVASQPAGTIKINRNRG